ncbi:MAG: mechanosensitive ion channel [Luteolibacter sp.]
MLDSCVQWYLERGMETAAAVRAGWWTSFGLLLLAACLLHFVLKFVIIRIVAAVVKRLRFKAPDTVLNAGVLRWLAHMTPAIFIHVAAPGFLGEESAVTETVKCASLLYLLLAGVLALYALMNGFVRLYEQRPMAREMPATSFVQVIKLLIALAALVMAVSVVIDRSPVIVFSGLGAMTAVLLLIFKDAILGFVAGIQLAANRMVAVGDWIEMPKYGADGDVEEVALTTVKVRNWDRTRTTIPTYALISDSFKNWRGMQEAGGRRIKRALYVDMQTIRLLDDGALSRLKRIRLLQPYFETKERELEEWYREQGYSSREEAGPNGRNLTNVGTYRVYAEAYLRNHPKIHQEMTLLVRHLAPGDHGLPMEIYCFTNDIRWAAYEGIQADIFDHLIAMAREFDLGIYQTPTGADLRGLTSRLLENAG